jgi:non-heme Fe2+,alpha-ketoglutarate-dependent halogenase
VQPPAAGADARRLTDDEAAQYRERGYVKNLPLFDAEGVARLQGRFDDLLARLPAGTDINKVNCWHKANRWVYDLCCTPAILDCVEDLIGPDIMLWGCQFFCKLPDAGERVSTDVPWHQDAQYWPLEPRETVTVWLAFWDTDDGNGAMRVVAGSHRAGMQEHHTVEGEKYVLAQAIDESHFDPADVVTIDLQAGQMSLHDDRLIHGSGASTSGRRRVGLTMRLSPPRVKCDLSVWPNFEAYLLRGVDDYGHNPPGKVPTGDEVPTKMFPLSREFS